MDRANSKHGRHLDEQMAKEVRNQMHGLGTGTRTQEWREPEPTDDGIGTAAPVAITPEEVENPSRLGRFLPRTAFPADRDRLMSAAMTMHAPDDVIATLEQLAPEPSYETVADVWAALGHGFDRRQ